MENINRQHKNQWIQNVWDVATKQIPYSESCHGSFQIVWKQFQLQAHFYDT